MDKLSIRSKLYSVVAMSTLPVVLVCRSAYVYYRDGSCQLLVVERKKVVNSLWIDNCFSSVYGVPKVVLVSF